MEHLRQVPDPRIERTRRHELMDLLVIALCAVTSEADHWIDVVQFGKAKKACAAWTQLKCGRVAASACRRWGRAF